MVQRDSILQGVVGEVHGYVVDADGVSDEMKGSTECNAMFSNKSTKNENNEIAADFLFWSLEWEWSLERDHWL